MSKALLIYRLGSIGDTVIALPCFHAIARAFPERRRILLTNIPVSAHASPAADVLGSSGLIQGEIAYPLGTRSIVALIRLTCQIRRIGADQFIYLMPERTEFALTRDLAFLRACGLKDALGAHGKSTELRVIDAHMGEVERECARLARSLSVLGPIDVEARENWDLRLTVGERAVARDRLFDVGFIAINMGGKVERNDWGAENWRSLLVCLTETYPSLGLVIVGGMADYSRARGLSEEWRGPIRNFCGSLSVRETAAVLERAVLFVGHDSGPMHLAAAVGSRIIALFGDNNPPKKWHPIGQQHICIHNSRGVREIHIHCVIEKIEACLGGRLR